MNTLELKGIDGGTPIGILAALGALRVITRVDSNARMGWRIDGAFTRPFVETEIMSETFAEAVCAEANHVAESVAAYGDVIKAPSEIYRQAALAHLEAKGAPCGLDDSDYFAAFACDAAVENEGAVKPTLLSFSNGGGMQFLLKDFRSLAKRCTAASVSTNILGDKPVLTECTGLNWDTSSLRSYALRWNDPNTDKKLTDVPMNALAFIGLASFPSVPSKRSLATAGFGNDHKLWSWPIWDGALSHAVVRSLLCTRHPPGVLCHFASRRFVDSKRIYFAPAVQT